MTAASAITTRQKHLDMLKEVLACDLRDDQRRTFEGMLDDLEEYPGEILSPGKTRFLRDVLTEHNGPPLNRLTNGPIPKGRDVQMASVLSNLPAKPPVRKK